MYSFRNNFHAILFYVFIYCFIKSCNAQRTVKNSNSALDDHFFNAQEIVIKISGSKHDADLLAQKYGFINFGEIPNFAKIYRFRRLNQRHRRRKVINETEILSESLVKWIEPQIELVRVKRDFLQIDSPEYYYKNLEHIKIDSEAVRLKNTSTIKTKKREISRNLYHMFNDELWNYQWYIWDKSMKNSKRSNMGIIEAWNMGYTGKGVVISVLDDGLETDHLDIKPNYDPQASADINDNDNDPTPRYNGENSHGTRCAGEIAMVANNRKCGVGVAYNSKVGGIRLLDGRVSDLVEALALSHNYDYVDIYSSSWGPHDDGATVDGPKSLTREAILKGIRHGRKGKGCIYVWANGNGGRKGDNCNCDGYAGSIYTISVGSVTESGKFPWYGEECSSTLAVTYSSGDPLELRIATIDLDNKCTEEHTGTSASAPIAAGVIALVLEANNNLTWRDMQHLIVWTSEIAPLKEARGWGRNSVGLMFNGKFGFGLMNAESMIRKAKSWNNVPKQRICQVVLRISSTVRIMADHETRLKFVTKSCRNTTSEINFIEHVQLRLNIRHPRRGRLEIKLISPSNTTSVLLTSRPNDVSTGGFENWYFTSVHFWGESAAGVWRVRIADTSNNNAVGILSHAQLILYGTRERPAHMRAGRKYNYESTTNKLSNISAHRYGRKKKKLGFSSIFL